MLFCALASSEDAKRYFKLLTAHASITFGCASNFLNTNFFLTLFLHETFFTWQRNIFCSWHVIQNFEKLFLRASNHDYVRENFFSKTFSFTKSRLTSTILGLQPSSLVFWNRQTVGQNMLQKLMGFIGRRFSDRSRKRATSTCA